MPALLFRNELLERWHGLFALGDLPEQRPIRLIDDCLRSKVMRLWI